jgi:predicted HTH transcriptional regulator
LGEKLGVRLGENEVKIIDLVLTDKYISAKKLSENIGISLTAVENNIAKLKAKGLLKRIGPAKGGHWEVEI